MRSSTRFALLTATAVLVLSGCTAATRTTAQVDSASFGRICLTPENSDKTDQEGCFPIAASDVAGIEQGDCIEAAIPADHDDRVTKVRKLDRPCHTGAEPKTSTSSALVSVIWIVAISAGLVYVGAVLPRRHARRIAGTLKPRRKVQWRSSPNVKPVDTVDDGGTTIVPVVEGDGDPDPPHRHKQ